MMDWRNLIIFFMILVPGGCRFFGARGRDGMRRLDCTLVFNLMIEWMSAWPLNKSQSLDPFVFFEMVIRSCYPVVCEQAKRLLKETMDGMRSI
jgi:hypothetical protein